MPAPPVHIKSERTSAVPRVTADHFGPRSTYRPSSLKHVQARSNMLSSKIKDAYRETSVVDDFVKLSCTTCYLLPLSPCPCPPQPNLEPTTHPNLMRVMLCRESPSTPRSYSEHTEKPHPKPLMYPSNASAVWQRDPFPNAIHLAIQQAFPHSQKVSSR